MDTIIVETASKVSTPLALAGLVAAFLFFVFRQIVARDIFPTLTNALGGKVILTIIDRIFIFALVGMLLGFFGYILPVIVGGPSPPPDGVSISFPPAIKLSDALKMIAENESCAVKFVDCSDTTLSNVVESGPIKAQTPKDLMEALQYRVKSPESSVRFQVKFIKEKGLYEIHCE